MENAAARGERQSRLDRETLKFVKGIGETRAKLLSKELELNTPRDLLYYFPFRHIDRSHYYTIGELSGTDLPAVQIRGRFRHFVTEGEGVRKRLIALFTDGRSAMEVTWFAGIQGVLQRISTEREYVIFGKPTLYRGTWQMAHPEIEEYNPSKPSEGLRGIYSLTDTLRKRGFSQLLMQKIMASLLDNAAMDDLEEALPAEMLKRLRLMPLRESLINLHMPSDVKALQSATERMKFEELFYLELNILRFARRRAMKTPGRILGRIGEKFNTFYSDVLPFTLTDAQKRVLREIRDDVRRGRQMNRLLQGDVGSGKTLVAFMSMLMAVDNGLQAALMAPTEILARQHGQTLKEWGDAIGVNVRVLTGSTRIRERREIHAGLLNGSIDILVGTHALIEDTVEFKDLGLVVIDEQHRFGVAQRARMWSKAQVPPHVLVMTATPIPRTLAMTVYGDLEVSVIDRLPPGRKPVDTWLRYDDNRMEVDRHIMRELDAGRQAYIVYPLIHENEKLSLKSLEEGLERVRDVFGKKYRIAFVHGQMKPDEKAHQMDLFVRGEARIMVATTVIEVGVNVPNASVMIIENAERFGLSQLHQLRGRVGRGADKSYCILMTKQNIGNDTRKRLNIMTQTTDGFIISEADMKLRGPGDMEGTMQSGLAFNLRVASLTRDGQILERARAEAKRLLDNPTAVSAEDAATLNRELARRFARTVDWSQIS